MRLHYSSAVNGLHPELAVDLADLYMPALDWIPDELISGEAPIAAEDDPLACHAGVHFLLVRHGLIELQRLYLAAFQLRLDFFKDAKGVLGHPGPEIHPCRLRRFRYLARVLPHSAPVEVWPARPWPAGP